MILEALLLGLSTGSYCIVSCAPVALPFLFSEDIKSVKQNSAYVGLWLIGRFIAYVAVGFLLSYAGSLAAGYVSPAFKAKLSAITWTIIGIFLVLNGTLYNFPAKGICSYYKKVYTAKRGAFLFGLLTGISICPPFIAAASKVIELSNPLLGALFFVFFFVGTTVYFIPLLGIVFIKNNREHIRRTARITMLILGIYFIWTKGILFN